MCVSLLLLVLWRGVRTLVVLVRVTCLSLWLVDKRRRCLSVCVSVSSAFGRPGLPPPPLLCPLCATNTCRRFRSLVTRRHGDGVDMATHAVVRIGTVRINKRIEVLRCVCPASPRSCCVVQPWREEKGGEEELEEGKEGWRERRKVGVREGR